MAARTARIRSGYGALGLCMALTACTDPELTTTPRPDTAVPRRLVGTATVADAGTLIVDRRTVKLWGIDALPRDAQCRSRTGSSWPCGAHAATALAEWIGTRSVNCDPRTRYKTDPAFALCRLNGRDIGKWLVMHGWARDAPAQSGGMYRTLERAATSKRRGMHGDPSATHEVAAP